MRKLSDVMVKKPVDNIPGTPMENVYFKKSVDEKIPTVVLDYTPEKKIKIAISNSSMENMTFFGNSKSKGSCMVTTDVGKGTSVCFSPNEENENKCCELRCCRIAKCSFNSCVIF